MKNNRPNRRSKCKNTPKKLHRSQNRTNLPTISKKTVDFKYKTLKQWTQHLPQSSQRPRRTKICYKTMCN